MAAQTTTPSTRQLPGPAFTMGTSALYGILVTHKSFLLGMRAPALEHHAHHLAHRIVGTRLPAELCDEIGKELFALQLEAADQLWKRMKHDPKARTEKFQYGASATLTKSELAGQARVFQLAADGLVHVKAVKADIDVPGGAEGKVESYMHLSAASMRPGMSLLVPGVAATSGGPSLSFASGVVHASNQASSATRPSFESVSVSWRGAGRATRMTQLDDVEASIHGWNQGLMETFVDQMKLKVVTVRGEESTGGGLKPQFMFLQTLTWR